MNVSAHPPNPSVKAGRKKVRRTTMQQRMLSWKFHRTDWKIGDLGYMLQKLNLKVKCGTALLHTSSSVKTREYYLV